MISDLVSLLSDAYVVYELCIRNIDTSRMTLLGRKERLIELIEEEDLNPEAVPRFNVHLTAGVDLQYCRILFNDLRNLFMLDNIWNASIVDARLKFLSSRVERIYTVGNSDEYNQKMLLLADIEQLFNELSRVMIPINADRTPTPSNRSSYHTPINPLCPVMPRAPYNPSVWKWDILFSGDDKQSASEFLQNVHDYGHSRGVAEADLLRSISDLLTGSARKWFRTNTAPFASWADFVHRFLRDFEPIYESDRLLDTIKGRMQQPDESTIQFFVTMEDLFLRLPRVLNERERVKIIRNNLLPSYVSALAVHEFQTIWELKECCKRVEASDICLKSRPSNDHNVSVPGNGLPSTNRTNQTNFKRNFPAVQYNNPRPVTPSNQNFYYRQPRNNQRFQNPNQIVQFVPRQSVPTNYGNFQNHPMGNRQQIQNYPYLPQNRNNVVNSIVNYPSEFVVASNTSFNPYPFDQPQVFDQYSPGSAYPYSYPINNYNDTLYYNSNQINQPTSAEHQFQLNDNIPNNGGNLMKNPASSQQTCPTSTKNNLSQTVNSPNSSRSQTGNERGIVGNGPAAVPEV